MDKLMMITFLVLSLLCLNANALTCYSCLSCSDPFSKSSGTVVTCNGTQTSCSVSIRIMYTTFLSIYFLNLIRKLLLLSV